MTHEVGAYLGGIRTEEDLRQRCWVDADTQCWHWRLAVVQGTPKVHLVTSDGRRRSMRGRRAALYLRRGKDLPKGHVAYAAACCRSDDCCNPDHASSGDRDAAGAALAASGRAKGLPAKIAASRATARTKLAKLTPEQVLEIRSSSETSCELAKRFGVSQFAVWSCKTGKSWKDQAVGASVFTAAAILTRGAP